MLLKGISICEINTGGGYKAVIFTFKTSVAGGNKRSIF